MIIHSDVLNSAGGTIYLCGTLFYDFVKCPFFVVASLLHTFTFGIVTLAHSHRREAVSTSLTMHKAKIDNLGANFCIM